jgi:hypothetical protein
MRRTASSVFGLVLAAGALFAAGRALPAVAAHDPGVTDASTARCRSAD